MKVKKLRLKLKGPNVDGFWPGLSAPKRRIASVCRANAWHRADHEPFDSLKERESELLRSSKMRVNLIF